MIRALIVLSLMASEAAADGRDNRKSPPPLPRKVYCLKVYSKPRCIPISREVIEAYGLKSGQSVTPWTMIKINDENERYRKTKLR